MSERRVQAEYESSQRSSMIMSRMSLLSLSKGEEWCWTDFGSFRFLSTRLRGIVRFDIRVAKMVWNEARFCRSETKEVD